ncbi:hypothetical protein [[Flexibacter] sp. ATCC 35103]|uniref:hypothetical protein n=1 Tax=[Flexibacter] sp. ATCC 35103 TaxID=1937528 RepID=UPI0009D391AE|nr:hypothetical protein [[Flexibacter] sp. ATCC 35103]OMQ10522.1 hypothetical protein BXU01_14715 [[Flexibacter] sp. ATCC 35103]
MKILLSLLIAFLFISCSTKNDRPEINGYVYDFETKLPIQNVSISSEKGIEAFTNKKGCFSLKK